MKIIYIFIILLWKLYLFLYLHTFIMEIYILQSKLLINIKYIKYHSINNANKSEAYIIFLLSNKVFKFLYIALFI
jgi:hypothetical protein